MFINANFQIIQLQKVWFVKFSTNAIDILLITDT